MLNIWLSKEKHFKFDDIYFYMRDLYRKMGKFIFRKYWNILNISDKQ